MIERFLSSFEKTLLLSGNNALPRSLHNVTRMMTNKDK